MMRRIDSYFAIPSVDYAKTFPRPISWKFIPTFLRRCVQARVVSHAKEPIRRGAMKRNVSVTNIDDAKPLPIPI
jgi:hypothetical protein